MEPSSFTARIWRKREYAVALTGVILIAIGLSELSGLGGLGGPDSGRGWYPAVGGGALVVGVLAKLVRRARRPEHQGRNGLS